MGLVLFRSMRRLTRRRATQRSVFTLTIAAVLLLAAGCSSVGETTAVGRGDRVDGSAEAPEQGPVADLRTGMENNTVRLCQWVSTSLQTLPSNTPHVYVDAEYTLDDPLPAQLQIAGDGHSTWTTSGSSTTVTCDFVTTVFSRNVTFSLSYDPGAFLEKHECREDNENYFKHGDRCIQSWVDTSATSLNDDLRLSIEGGYKVDTTRSATDGFTPVLRAMLDELYAGNVVTDEVASDVDPAIPSTICAAIDKDLIASMLDGGSSVAEVITEEAAYPPTSFGDFNWGPTISVVCTLYGDHPANRIRIEFERLEYSTDAPTVEAAYRQHSCLQFDDVLVKECSDEPMFLTGYTVSEKMLFTLGDYGWGAGDTYETRKPKMAELSRYVKEFAATHLY